MYREQSFSSSAYCRTSSHAGGANGARGARQRRATALLFSPPCQTRRPHTNSIPPPSHPLYRNALSQANTRFPRISATPYLHVNPLGFGVLRLLLVRLSDPREAINRLLVTLAMRLVSINSRRVTGEEAVENRPHRLDQIAPRRGADSKEPSILSGRWFASSGQIGLTHQTAPAQTASARTAPS